MCVCVVGGGGDKNLFFSFGRIKTLVAMAAYSFHRLIMRKVEMTISVESLGIFFFLYRYVH